MDLRSFSKTQEPQQNTTEGNPLNENDVRRAIKHFSGMTNDQLMRELSKHIQAKRAKGEQAEIATTIERIKPLLNEDQRKRLNEIMGSI